MNKSNLWTKDFIILLFANFFVALNFYLLMTTLAVYVIEQFNASQSEAGLAAGIFIIASLFARLLTGKYIEIIGRRKLLYSSLVLFLLSTLLYFPVNSLNILLAVRIIHGIAFGITTTTAATAVMDMIPDERKGEGTSYFSLSPTAATAFGPFIGLFILQRAGFEALFTACALFSAISLIIIIFSKIPEANVTKEHLQALKARFGIHDFFEKKAFPISIMMVIMGIAYSGIVSFVNSYAIEIQQQNAAAYFFIVYAIFLFISRPFTGRLLDLKGDNVVIYPAILLFSLSLLLLSQAHSAFVLLLAGALAALGFGTIMSCSQAIAIKESPKHRVGLATSTFFICMDGGMGVGPFLTGLLVPFLEYRGMYLTLAVAVLLSIILYYNLHGKYKTGS
ncbi:MAG TPA: MFS transporter [Firmicutes bacterium]|nr:MFS transporter [Bacillota bacterium]